MRKTCPCGQQFDADDGRQRRCPTCQEARNNARYPAKSCQKCGKVTRDLFKRRRFCLECYEAMRGNPFRRDDSERAKRRQEYLASYEQQPADQQWDHFMTLLKWILDRLPDVAPVEEPTVNPEEVDADDQDAVDSAFRDLMDGVL